MLAVALILLPLRWAWCAAWLPIVIDHATWPARLEAGVKLHRAWLQARSERDSLDAYGPSGTGKES